MNAHITIQNYKSEYLPGIQQLYDSLMPEAPCIFRNKDYFNYFATFPGVRDDGVFVAMSHDGLAGLAIVALASGKYTTGKVIELWAKDAAIEKALIQRAEEYCRDAGADALEFNLPTFPESRDSFSGWIRVDQRGALMAKPLELQPLIRAVAKSPVLDNIRKGKRVLFVCREFEANAADTEGTVAIINDTENRGDLRDAIVIKTDLKILAGVIFSSINLYLALLRGQIKVTNISNIYKAIQILRNIRVSQPWTVAIADER